MLTERKNILILCKTYPSPSSRYVETSCVAGMEESGKLIRLFPVPFRLVNDEQQFKKWQWISAYVRKANGDHRPESHRISVDTIEVLGDPLSLQHEWLERRQAIAPLKVYDDFQSLEEARKKTGVTLGLVRPSRLTKLDITKADSPEWTEEEINKLMQDQLQASLFEQESERRSLKLLRKLPFNFHYHYECQANGETRAYKHKIVDWEIGSLYWNTAKRPDWEPSFRQKLFDDFSKKDLLFLMGTIHRFPDRWLIISLIYPPRSPAAIAGQARLF